VYGYIAKFLAWLAQKIGAVVLIALLAVTLVAAWIYIRESREAPARPSATTQVLSAERNRLQLAQAELERRVASFREEIVVQRQRVEQAERVIETLRALESWWDRIWGNPEQQKANADQLEKMHRLRGDSIARLEFLVGEIRRSGWEGEGLEISLATIERELALATEDESGPLIYVERAWIKIRVWLIAGVLAFLFGPTLWALFLFFILAPLAQRSPPIRLAEEAGALPGVGHSRVSVEAALRPGDCLRVKEGFLQSSDESLHRRTRFVLDWKIPFTSLACGLVELVEMHNEARADRRVTLSNADDPHVELSLVELPVGGALVLRPQFLAGVIHEREVPLVIRRRWQVFRLQSWISGQFRYFEFHGPCRLIVAGSRGVRAENLDAPASEPGPVRRTNQDGTIGFTPGLTYRPVRAETFWGYYRGMNPLFDDLFSGRGVFIVQETATGPGGAARAGRFWSGVWNGVLKVFGI
jgi:hypothetical protein